MALFCVVCGRGSTRTNWKSGSVNGVSYVSCDFHSQPSIEISVIDSGGVSGAALTSAAQNGKIRKTIHDSGGE